MKFNRLRLRRFSTSLPILCFSKTNLEPHERPGYTKRLHLSLAFSLTLPVTLSILWPQKLYRHYTVLIQARLVSFFLSDFAAHILKNMVSRAFKNKFISLNAASNWGRLLFEEIR